jgi:hypothetical protein
MKDPAVLFYTSDFISGTYTMSDEQVGKYIRLLCLQHQKLRLTEKDMLFICKSYDEDIWKKFTKDEDGFYNKRMDDEANKRKSYSESRRNNRKQKHMKNISSSYEKHMGNENENINENINRDVVVKEKAQRKKFIIPSVEDVQAFANENMIGSKDLPERFVNYYEANGWMINRNHMRNWQAAFKNWVKNEKKYETNQRTNGKQFASETPAERKERQYRDFGKSLNGGNELPDFFAITNFE